MAKLCYSSNRIVYDPDKDKAFWVNITEILKDFPELINTGPYVITVPANQEFDSSTIDKLRNIYPKKLKYENPYKFAELLFSEDVGDRWQGFFGITNSQSTLNSKLTCSLLIKLTCESNLSLRANVYDVISRYVSHPEVSFSPLDNSVTKYMENEINNFDYSNILGMIECVDEEGFERGTFGQSFVTLMQYIPNLWQHLRYLIFMDSSVSEVVKGNALLVVGICNIEKALPSLKSLQERTTSNSYLRGYIDWTIEYLENQ
ncbi:MAG: hypothetical protein J4F36_13985 [Nitrosopumilaceae archaeon]|nr:hypothetical protein [Nitrosopumilaceae archaeon]